jgi:hypothetical protein
VKKKISRLPTQGEKLWRGLKSAVKNFSENTPNRRMDAAMGSSMGGTRFPGLREQLARHEEAEKAWEAEQLKRDLERIRQMEEAEARERRGGASSSSGQGQGMTDEEWEKLKKYLKK